MINSLPEGDEPQAHKVTWFAPDRPVDGTTTYVRPAETEDDE